jgi:hypothetical protein
MNGAAASAVASAALGDRHAAWRRTVSQRAEMRAGVTIPLAARAILSSAAASRRLRPPPSILTVSRSSVCCAARSIRGGPGDPSLDAAVSCWQPRSTYSSGLASLPAHAICRFMEPGADTPQLASLCARFDAIITALLACIAVEQLKAAGVPWPLRFLITRILRGRIRQWSASFAAAVADVSADLQARRTQRVDPASDGADAVAASAAWSGDAREASAAFDPDSGADFSPDFGATGAKRAAAVEASAARGSVGVDAGATWRSDAVRSSTKDGGLTTAREEAETREAPNVLTADGACERSLPRARPARRPRPGVASSGMRVAMIEPERSRCQAANWAGLCTTYSLRCSNKTRAPLRVRSSACGALTGSPSSGSVGGMPRRLAPGLCPDFRERGLTMLRRRTWSCRSNPALTDKGWSGDDCPGAVQLIYCASDARSDR